jgi:hypothetical protein
MASWASEKSSVEGFGGYGFAPATARTRWVKIIEAGGDASSPPHRCPLDFSAAGKMLAASLAGTKRLLGAPRTSCLDGNRRVRFPPWDELVTSHCEDLRVPWTMIITAGYCIQTVALGTVSYPHSAFLVTSRPLITAAWPRLRQAGRTTAQAPSDPITLLMVNSVRVSSRAHRI